MNSALRILIIEPIVLIAWLVDGWLGYASGAIACLVAYVLAYDVQLRSIRRLARAVSDIGFALSGATLLAPFLIMFGAPHRNLPDPISYYGFLIVLVGFP